MSWSIIFSGSSARSRSALMLALASWAMRPRTVCFSTMRSCLSVSAGDRCWSGLRRSEAAAPSTAAAAAVEGAAASDLRRPDQHRSPALTERQLRMVEKQTVLGRIAQLAKANINALLDRAEDPEKMIDQLIRDY